MFTIQFNCKQYGAAYPDVKQDKLELTEEVKIGCRSHETYIVSVYDEETPIYCGSDCVETLKQFITRYNANFTSKSNQ